MGILRSLGVVSGSTLVSRVLGMVRDITCASLLGAGAAWDAFVVAWRIPNLFRRLLGEGALSLAFIPTFSGERERGGARAAFEFFSSVLTLLSIVLAGVTVVGAGAALLLPGTLFGTGAAADKARLTLDLLAILFPYVFLVNVMALFMAILNTMRHFFAPAIAPAVLNVFWIAGALLAPHLAGGPAGEVKVVAAAILAGGAVQLLMQVPFLRSRGVPLRPRFRFRTPALTRMLLLMFPMVLGLAPVQVNLLVDTLIAEAFVPGNGANSYLFYGNRLVQLPLALIGIALGVVVFPELARLAKAGRREEVGRTFSGALRLALFLALPAAAGLLVLRHPLISLIYERGAFGSGDSSATAFVLAMYAVGIPSCCGLQIVTRLFYAVEEVKTPVRVGAAMVLVNLTLNLVLVGPLREGGLALSTSISATLNVVLLAVLARRRLGVGGLGPVARAAAGFLLLAVLMAGLVLAVHLALLAAAGDRGLPARLLLVLPPALAGAGFYLGAARLFHVREMRSLPRGR